MTLKASEGPAVSKQPRILADLRRAAGLSQAQVADRMGVRRARVGHIEAKYPNINYGTLIDYIQAIGGGIQFIVGTTHASADQLIPDPAQARTRAYLKEESSRPGVRRLHAEAAFLQLPEELVLQGEQTDTGSDDTGGQVDHADTQRDQSDSGQGQQG